MPEKKTANQSTRFLKQYIIFSDNHGFVGRIFDLSVVGLNFETYEDLARYPDCKYAIDTDFWLSSMVRRVESLNMAGEMLWLNSKFLKQTDLPVSRYQWLNIAADVFLMRFVSVVDCALLLTNEVFETALEPRLCSISSLQKAGVPQNVLDVLKQISSDQGSLRDERNVRFHRGLERELSSDDSTFRMAALFEHRGSGMRGDDAHGRRINTERYLKEGLVELQRDFNVANRNLSKSLNRLYDFLWEEFESRFSPLFNDPKRGFGATILNG